MTTLRVEHDLWRHAYEVAVSRHGETIVECAKVFDEMERERVLVSLRKAIKDEGVRYFIALLLNVPTGRAIMEAVRARIGCLDVVDTVMKWVAEIEGQPAFQYKMTATDRSVLRAVLKGCLDGADDVFAQKASWCRMAGATEPDDEEWCASLQRLKKSMILKILFEAAPDDVRSSRADHMAKLLAHI